MASRGRWAQVMTTSESLLDAGLPDWRKLAQALHARFVTIQPARGLAFVTAVIDAAEQADHHPEVTLTFAAVGLTLVSHDVGRVTGRDLRLARRISEIASEQGIDADPHAVTQLELALDTADLAAVGPFWAAVLTGTPDSLHGEDIVDARGRVPALWLQPTEAHETPRQRFHLDIWVPHDVAADRIAAALVAGGQMIDDSGAPAYVVLADPEGNKVCVCTSLGR